MKDICSSRHRDIANKKSGRQFRPKPLHCCLSGSQFCSNISWKMQWRLALWKLVNWKVILWIEEVLDVSIGNTVCGGGSPRGLQTFFLISQQQKRLKGKFPNNREDWKEIKMAMAGGRSGEVGQGRAQVGLSILVKFFRLVSFSRLVNFVGQVNQVGQVGQFFKLIKFLNVFKFFLSLSSLSSWSAWSGWSKVVTRRGTRWSSRAPI